MSKISRRGLRISAAAAGAGVIAAAALAAAVHAGPADAATSTMNSGATTDVSVRLAPMPRGIVVFGRDRRGEVDVTVAAFGLTPGSSHTVELVNGSGRVVITRFGPLTANSAGQAVQRLDTGIKSALGSWRLVVLNGTAGDRVADEPIARTHPYHRGRRVYRLIALETDAHGKDWGAPRGLAVIAYNPKVQTISVTVNAIGFTPGAHAAHIHVGSCVSQGPVRYMLVDFTANADGRIVDQTRVVTNVTTPLPAHGWYLNLHQGNSGDILANGRPTIDFRPLLCGDIVP